MKFTINVDCTPEEARRFFGLPDMDAINQHMQDSMNIWAPQNMEHFQELQKMIWDQMGGAMMGAMNTDPTSSSKTDKKKPK